MAKALEEQLYMNGIDQKTVEDRLDLLGDREIAAHDSQRVERRMHNARFRINTAIEDVDLCVVRDIGRSLCLTLTFMSFFPHNINVLVTKPTGPGKTYLICALSQESCREEYTMLYNRLPWFLENLAIARGDGAYTKFTRWLSRADLLVLDDWGLAHLLQQSRCDLLKRVDDRYDTRFTIVTGQFPMNRLKPRGCSAPNRSLSSESVVTSVGEGAKRGMLTGRCHCHTA